MVQAWQNRTDEKGQELDKTGQSTSQDSTEQEETQQVGKNKTDRTAMDNIQNLVPKTHFGHHVSPMLSISFISESSASGG